MTIQHFKNLLDNNNGIRISDTLVVFSDYELYSFETDKSKKYKNLDELIADNKIVEEIILNTDEFYYSYGGGRGASSGNGETRKAFGHARGGGGKNETLLNAELNYGTAGGNSVDSVLKRFQDKYGKADREYGIAVDENGYVYQHIKGGKHSVAIHGNKGQTLIHNHPSGSHFSDTDLISISLSKAKTIIATSSNSKIRGTYTFTKGNHFKANEFVKAVKKARVGKNLTYNQGINKWLKDNAKKYGYTYTKSRNANLKGM